MKPKLEERSAVYLAPDPQRVPLDLSETERARLAHLEGMVTALQCRVDELEKRIAKLEN